MNQTTIQRVVTCSGIGLHSGNKVYLALRPASANTGIIFDIHTPDGIRRVSPAPKAVATTVLATTLGSNGATVSTVEHLLASVLGLGIDNLIISVEGGEIPIMDGSAAAFLELFAEAGIRELPAPLQGDAASAAPWNCATATKYIRALPYAGFPCGLHHRLSPSDHRPRALQHGSDSGKLHPRRQRPHLRLLQGRRIPA